MGIDWYARGETKGRSTPGPWKWEDLSGVGAQLRNDEGASVLFVDRVEDVRIDDAAVIAAAPEMLALLREYVRLEDLDTLDEDEYVQVEAGGKMNYPVTEKARALLARLPKESTGG